MPYCRLAYLLKNLPSVCTISEGDDVGPSVCVHTSVPFSLKHLEEDKEAVCTEYVLPIVRQILPQLPEPDRYKSHKWRFSQVLKLICSLLFTQGLLLWRAFGSGTDFFSAYFVKFWSFTPQICTDLRGQKSV